MHSAWGRSVPAIEWGLAVKRDLEALAAERYDLLVVGGGIQGACIAWQGALQGLKTALIERSDFASGSSSNSLKIAHGGLRHLQRLSLLEFRRAVQARRYLMRLAPDLVFPLPCVTPAYGMGLRNPLLLRAALLLNDLLSVDRDRGLEPERRLPRGALLGQAALVDGCALDYSRYRRGAVWHDALMDNTERLCLGVLHAAVAAGARVANYVEAEGLLTPARTCEGVRARDVLTGGEFELRTRTTVLAAAEGNEAIVNADSGSADGGRPWLRAWNLVVARQLCGGMARTLAVEDRYADGRKLVGGGRRELFLVPWRQGTLIGTGYDALETRRPYVTQRELQSMLDTVSSSLHRNEPPLTPADVVQVHCGALPARRVAGQPTIRTDPIWRALEGAHGAFLLEATKYTLAPVLAEAAVRRVCRRLGRSFVRQKIGPLQGPRGRPDSGSGAAGDRLEAEVLFAVRDEMALTLEDIVRRRMDAGSFSCPELATLRDCARIAAGELGWDEERTEREIAACRASYMRCVITDRPGDTE